MIAFDPAAVASDMRARLRESGRRWAGSRRPGLMSASESFLSVDLIRVFERARSGGLDPVLWVRPDTGEARLAVGTAISHVADGPDRFAVIQREWDRLRGAALPDAAGGGRAPRAFVGFAFAPARTLPVSEWDGFPAGLLVVPQLLFEGDGHETRVTVTVMAGGDGETDRAIDLLGRLLIGPASQRRDPEAAATRTDVPESGRWTTEVLRARNAIRGGTMEKVVLARAARLERGSGEADGSDGPDGSVDAALATLIARYPGCRVFAVARGRRCFLGATPERLVELRDGTVRVSCVAGTAARGADADADRRYADALRASVKDQAEHEVVVRAVRDDLAPLCDAVVVAERPTLLRLANVQHLLSEVTARVRPGIGLLDLAAALHPTAAVGGWPRREAARWIEAHEGFERGWYAGPLGWVDARGDGELFLGIRSALVAPGGIWLFAGCGIVAGSDPEAELAESELKLRPLLEALGAA